MNPCKTALFAFALGLMPALASQAHAYVLVNPADLSPTAIQQSGATYGPNVYTSRDGARINPTRTASRDFDEDDYDHSITQSTILEPTEVVTFMDEPDENLTALSQKTPVHHPHHHAAMRDQEDVHNDVTLRSDEPDQQAQKTALNQTQNFDTPRSGVSTWFIVLLALIVAGGIIAILRNRDTHHSIKM
jgi:hypothetical protein